MGGPQLYGKEEEEKPGSHLREKLPGVVDYGGYVIVIHDEVD